MQYAWLRIVCLGIAPFALAACSCGDGPGDEPDTGMEMPADAGPDAPPLPDAGPMDAPPIPDAGPVDAPMCGSDAECDDGVFCNGAELCVSGACVADADGEACEPTQMCDEMRGLCVNDCDLDPDADDDGHSARMCGGDDCADNDGDRFPGNDEDCDAHDEDCNTTTVGVRDLDSDGETDSRCCNPDPAGGMPQCGVDCDDTRRRVRTIATETCDGYDNDCNGVIDEGVLVDGFVDADRDGVGSMPMMGCPFRAGFSTLGGDCADDPDPLLNTRYRSPLLPEICDGIDNNCDGRADEVMRPVTWYRDADRDQWGNAASGTMESCTPIPGYDLYATDCDDGNPRINPGATDVCNGLDDDCNGIPDAIVGPGDFEDDDRDGVADRACPAGPDCDDGDYTSYPDAPEITDARDNDCNTMIDDVAGGESATWYDDFDGDSWGDGATGAMSAAPVPGRVPRAGDCDDRDANRYPGASDGCDGIDADCDMIIDENGVRRAFYPDADGDGEGALGAMLSLFCDGLEPAGYVPELPGDCDDGNPMIEPGADERCAMPDGIDNDCDLAADCDDTDCRALPACAITHTLAIASGDAQSAVATAAFGAPIEIRLQTIGGSPVVGATVTMTPLGGSAPLVSSVATTAGGIARFDVRAGAIPGAETLRVSAMGASPVIVRVTVTAPGAGTIISPVNVLHAATGAFGIPGPAIYARFAGPFGLAVAPDETVYVAARGSHQVYAYRRSGAIDLVAGDGTMGTSGDGGPARVARLSNPAGLALDATRNRLYIGSSDNPGRVRYVDLGTGIIYPYAGGGTIRDPGAGTSPTSLLLASPMQLVVRRDGTLYVTDASPRVLEINPSGGRAVNKLLASCADTSVPLLLADCGGLACPMALDDADRLFVAGTFWGSRVASMPSCGYGEPAIARLETDGSWDLVAGRYGGSTSENVAAGTASVSSPSALAFDAGGNLLFAEDSTTPRIRRIDGRTGRVVTIAGGAARGGTGDLGPATAARITSALGLGFVRGHLIFTDEENDGLRQVWGADITVPTPSVRLEIASGDGQMITLADVVGAPWNVRVSAGGMPLGGVRVLYEALDPGTALYTTVSTTAGDGIASASGRVGLQPRADRVRASAFDIHGQPLDGSPVTFTANAVAPAPGTIFTAVNVLRVSGRDGVPGPSTFAELTSANGFARDSAGNVYVTDSGNDRVLRLSAAGHLESIAGGGGGGFSGDLGPARDALLNGPTGIALDEGRNRLYVADFFNNRVRVIDLGATPPTIDTWAGGGTVTTPPYGDGMSPRSATFSGPKHLAIGPADGALYVSDTGRTRIRRIPPDGSTITTALGTRSPGCTGAYPVELVACTADGCSVAVDMANNLYVTGTLWGTAVNSRPACGYGEPGIVMVTPAGVMTHVAGYNGTMTGEGVAATMTNIGDIGDVALDAAANVTFIEVGSGPHRVRRIDRTTGLVTTLAGGGPVGAGDYIPGPMARLDRPYSIRWFAGHLWIGSVNTNDVRIVW